MEDYIKLNNKLYASKYGLSTSEKTNEIWDSIKYNKELLKWAIEPTKDKLKKRDIVNGLAISDNILDNFDNVDQDVYQELVDLIYYNKQIARISVNDNNSSFLLKTLYNPNLILTINQKAFAVNEAMNKIGTIRNENYLNEYFDIKVANTYMSGIFNILSDTQSHGSGVYDIRYWILKNSNWIEEEKIKLIYNFWENDKDYQETFEAWEKNAEIKQDTNELEFCKKMKELRPPIKSKTKVLTK